MILLALTRSLRTLGLFFQLLFLVYDVEETLDGGKKSQHPVQDYSLALPGKTCTKSLSGDLTPGFI